MKNTKAKLEALREVSIFEDESSYERIHCRFDFYLVREDWEEFLKHCDFINEHNKSDNDEADNMLALLTYAIHQMHTARTGEPWTLRIDRKGN